MRDSIPVHGKPLAAAILAALQAASLQAQAAQPASPQQLPKISVDAQGQLHDDSYKVDKASSRKYTQPLLDTPQTITVIPPAVIKERGAATLRDVLRNSPGITFQAGEGGGGLPGDQNFTMRGFSSRNSLFIDEVRDIGAYARDSFNLEQVEVIKGPAGSVAGRSATSGAINQVSKTPHLGDSQDYSLGYGSDDYKRVTADANFGLSDSSALRLNAMYHDAEVSNRDVVENKRYGFAPSLALGLGTATRVTLSYFYMEEDNVPDYGLPWAAANANPKVDQSNFYGLKDYDFEDIESQTATAQIEHDFSEALTLRNVLRYLDTERSSAITAPRPPNRQLQRRDMAADNVTNLTDLTFKFATGGLQHALVTGLELSRETTDNRNSSQTTNQPTTTLYNPDPNERPLGPMPPNLGSPATNPTTSETRADTVAVFVRDTVALNDQWQVAGGARYDDVDIDYDARNFVTGAPIESLSKSEGELTWSAAVIYKPIETGSIYLSYGTGFDPTVDAGTVGPGLSTTATAANNINLDPEESSNLELGTKWDLLDERLSLTAAVFEIEKTNIRTRNTNNDPYILAGEQRVRGLELGATGSITPAWSVFSGFLYLDSEFKHSANAIEIGEVLLLTPEFSFNAWTTYALPFGLTVGAGVQYIDEVVRSRSVTGELMVPSYVLIDAMASYQVNDLISLQLNATNLADKEYIDRIGGGHYIPGPGRTVSLTANFSF